MYAKPDHSVFRLRGKAPTFLHPHLHCFIQGLVALRAPTSHLQGNCLPNGIEAGCFHGLRQAHQNAETSRHNNYPDVPEPADERVRSGEGASIRPAMDEFGPRFDQRHRCYRRQPHHERRNRSQEHSSRGGDYRSDTLHRDSGHDRCPYTHDFLLGSQACNPAAGTATTSSRDRLSRTRECAEDAGDGRDDCQELECAPGTPTWPCAI